jgi:hypothetical protein
MLQNKKLENNFFLFSSKESKKEKKKTRRDQKTNFWSNADHRESLTILNKLIKKDSQNRLKPLSRKHKKS